MRFGAEGVSLPGGAVSAVDTVGGPDGSPCESHAQRAGASALIDATMKLARANAPVALTCTPSGAIHSGWLNECAFQSARTSVPLYCWAFSCRYPLKRT